MHKTGHDVNCAYCGKEFHVPAWRLRQAAERGQTVKYCSNACSTEGRSGPRATTPFFEKTCEYCGASYTTRRAQARYCSLACSARGNRAERDQGWRETGRDKAL